MIEKLAHWALLKLPGKKAYLVVGSSNRCLQNVHEAEIFEITDDLMSILAEGKRIAPEPPVGRKTTLFSTVYNLSR